MKTILFANPPWWQVGDNGELRQGVRAGSRWPFTRQAYHAPGQFRAGGYLPAPYFLQSAAGYAGKALQGRFRAILRDSVARGESYPQFMEEVAKMQPECLVLETGAASWEHDLALIEYLKGKHPGLRVAVAGPTVGSAKGNARPGAVDCWMMGEYDKNSVLFAEGAEGVLGYNLLSKEELGSEELAYPMHDEEIVDHYWDACPSGQKAPHLQIWGSRGCPYKCCFCAWPGTMTSNDPDGTMPRSVRHYSPKWIAGYIRHFLTNHPATKSIYFDDDTFNLSNRHVVEVCKVMKEIGIPWSAMCRADTSTKDTWRAMKDAGCFGVKIGFESGSQRVIDQIVNKRLNLESARETAIWLRRDLGITVHGTFTVGLPGETNDESEETLQFIRKLYADGGLDTHQLSGTAMIENTPLAQIAEGKELAAYPGAIAGKSFVADRDGVKKLEGLNK